MAVERYGSKTDVVVKLVLVFFIALLSFSIGTFVGKKFSDNQHKLAELEPDNHGVEVAAEDTLTEAPAEEARGVASVHPGTGDMKPEKALTDDEIAKLAEEFVTDDEKSPAGEPAHLNDKNETGHTQAKNETEPPAAAHGAHGEAPTGHAPASVHPAEPAKPVEKAEAHAAAPAHTTQTEAPLKPAQRMAEGKSPVVENPTAAPSRIPSSLPKEMASSAIGKYTVQVASFLTEKDAQVMSADLKGKGFSAFYVSAKVNGETRFRVSVGLFTTQKEADAYKKDLLARAKISSALVQQIKSAE